MLTISRLKRRILPCLGLIAAIASWMLGPCSLAEAAPLTTDGATARAVFQSAYEHRYTWDDQFPGYATEVSLRHNKTLYRGLARINPDLSVTVSLSDKAVRQLVTDQLQMVAIHHRQMPFEAIHGQHQFQFEGTDKTGAVEIQELGDEMDSRYKVRDQKIVQVNRRMGPVAVTVNTLGFFTPPEGYLVAHYQSILRDPQSGEQLEKEDVRDVYDKVGQYYLLTRRYIRRTDATHLAPDLADDTLMSFDAIQPLRQAQMS